MKTSQLARAASKGLQRGVAAVEFALIVPAFLLLLLGAIEFGRLFYLWNTAQEVTRNAARQAVVSKFDATSTAAIQCYAVFPAKGQDCSQPTALPASTEISNANVIIRYLNAAGAVASPMPVDPGDNIAACLDSGRVTSCIRYVEVCVSLPLDESTTCHNGGRPIPFRPMIGLFSGSDLPSPDLRGISIPLSTVRMPAESLGFDPTS